MNWEEKGYAITGVLLLTLPYFGVTPFTISEAIKSVGLSVDTTSSAGSIIVLTGISAAIVGFLQTYMKKLQRRGTEATARFRHGLWLALSVIALVLTILYASTSILPLVDYPVLTEFGAPMVGSFVFGAVCSVSFAARVLSAERPPSLTLCSSLGDVSHRPNRCCWNYLGFRVSVELTSNACLDFTCGAEAILKDGLIHHRGESRGIYVVPGVILY